jgi:hypothetical protein
MANFTAKQVLSVAKTGLEKAVARWLNQRASDYDGDPCGPLRDLFHGGCQSGMVSGLVYYKDTCKFYRQHKADIWELILDRAEEYGSKNAFEFLAGLNHNEPGSVEQVENFLAWLGFEEAARNIESRLNSGDCDEEDDEDN